MPQSEQKFSCATNLLPQLLQNWAKVCGVPQLVQNLASFLILQLQLIHGFSEGVEAKTFFGAFVA